MNTWTARAHELRQAQAAVLANILLEINPDSTEDQHRYIPTAAGDHQRLRGIPALARGVGSTMPGTNPLAALIAKERPGR